MGLISFDFDSTLTMERDIDILVPEPAENIILLAKELACGFELVLITSRMEKFEDGGFDDVRACLRRWGILELFSSINFTNGEGKAVWCKRNGLIPSVHFDDDSFEGLSFSEHLPSVAFVLVSNGRSVEV